jgi:signal transduction histidine kinase
MRLSVSYNRVNFLTSALILVLTGVLYYLFIHSLLTDRIDRDLAVEENEIRQYTATYQKLPLPASFLDQQVSYTLHKPQDPEREFSYTSFYNAKAGKKEPGRSLSTALTLGGTIYQVTITKSRVAVEDLVRNILLITLTVSLVLLLVLLLMNRFFFNRLWQPFYSILSKMKAFDITNTEALQTEPTGIDEFRELKASVDAMAERVRKDYRELKNFTDNASHEMMTPLAVITLKLDSLLQTGGLSAKQAALIEEIYLAAGRLSRLHQSLLLLAKIENNLISDIQFINFSELVRAKISQFQELIDNNGLKLDCRIEESHVQMSRFLAEILLNNLLSNAIRHNIQGGEIKLELDQVEFKISNTGTNMDISSRMFDRFSKSPESEGMGLGLAISKQICNLYGFQLDYVHAHNRHLFTLQFHAVPANSL